jgi:ABC-type antimicrobial peptide transport system permease subunit
MTEFGVRRALGATEGAILALVLKRSVLLAMLGAAVGLPLAAAGAGVMGALLFGVRPLDRATLVAAPAAVFLLVLAASWQPARCGMRIDPARALRRD